MKETKARQQYNKYDNLFVEFTNKEVSSWIVVGVVS